MRVVIQRVLKASVKVNNESVGEINNGLLVFAGYEDVDNQMDVEWICNKIVNLRIFNDEEAVMNKNVKEVNGNVLLISQFTLHASTKNGNRPSYIKASKPDIAIPMYNATIKSLENILEQKIETGIFGADMKVELINDGPVTITMDSKNKE